MQSPREKPQAGLRAVQVTGRADPERPEELVQVSSRDWQPAGGGGGGPFGDGCPAPSRRACWRQLGGGGRGLGSAAPIGRVGGSSRVGLRPRPPALRWPMGAARGRGVGGVGGGPAAEGG
jgi:hypothetical protein